ncbi:3-dehydroquinate synthase [Natronospirillum operosum]|uniref:3-dehydroquinate synthase n=1 Tax=Natronospirillum operosum TaxID=2759953 RepID=A0A4Z0W665_9GAMM|nr:3-dehydroquinate synthase [Natronospirillum operosum]TGG93284.1 3-dehydroquinate synthase [Natronospirillum operosum]
MKTLSLDLPAHHYDIHIGAGLLAQAELLAPHLSPEVLVVTNETIAPLYLARLEAALVKPDANRRIESVVLPDGEQHKHLRTLDQVFTRLLELNYSRRCTLLALGGGVIGDMTGFAAACYQRGVNYIQLPTTLLSQVDSSVGGKTGVNHALGKNMIGAFKQPELVLIDTDTLSTLPDREYAAGLAEVLKYGLIADAGFFDWLEQHWSDLLARRSDVVSEAIYRSCALKAEVVAEDETEQGRRAILNLGHTFGHAIETWTGYGAWLHGEAVATGLLMATDLSQRLGHVDVALVERVRTLLLQAELPVRSPTGMARDNYLQLMARDKKVESGVLRLVLLNTLGHAIVTSDFAVQALYETIDHFKS